MTRLIDVEKLIKGIEEVWDWETIDGINATTVLKQTISDIRNEPTVDAEPVRHARLINAHPYGECSCCGELIDSRDRFRYCPHCGAKLDGDKHESD